MDFAALTDHDATMADEEFADLFLVRGDDQLVTVDGAPIASRMACDDGHQVLVTVGGENQLMPIMLDRHVAGTLEERHAIYNGDDPAAVAAFREAGATVWIPHTEQRTADELLPLEPDGIEVYKLHANIDPDIREDYLGLDGAGAITAAIEFADLSDDGPVPDLALLSFLSAEPAGARQLGRAAGQRPPRRRVGRHRRPPERAADHAARRRARRLLPPHDALVLQRRPGRGPRATPVRSRRRCAAAACSSPSS